MATLEDLDLAIAKLRYVEFGDLVTPDDHNTLLDCLFIINDLIDCPQLNATLAQTVYRADDEIIAPEDHNLLVQAVTNSRDCIAAYKDTSNLDAVIARLRTVATGDYILSNDHNDLVDAIKEIRKLLPIVAPVKYPRPFDYELYRDNYDGYIAAISVGDGGTLVVSRIDTAKVATIMDKSLFSDDFEYVLIGYGQKILTIAWNSTTKDTNLIIINPRTFEIEDTIYLTKMNLIRAFTVDDYNKAYIGGSNANDYPIFIKVDLANKSVENIISPESVKYYRVGSIAYDDVNDLLYVMVTPTVITGAYFCELICYDMDLNEKWRTKINNFYATTPLTVDNNGYVYFHTDSQTTTGRLFSYDSNGNLRWYKLTPVGAGDEPTDPLQVDRNGRIWVHYVGGLIYCYNPDGSVYWYNDIGVSLAKMAFKIVETPEGPKDFAWFTDYNGNFYKINEDGAASLIASIGLTAYCHRGDKSVVFIPRYNRLVSVRDDNGGFVYDYTPSNNINDAILLDSPAFKELADPPWLTAPEPKPSPVGAATIGNKLYVLLSDGSFYEYDPLADTWNSKATGPFANRQGVVFFSDGTFIYAGGGVQMFVGAYNDFYKYDPSTDTWTALNNFPAPVLVLAAGGTPLLYNNKIYVVVGDSPPPYYAKVYEYDPSTDTWAYKSDVPGTQRVDGLQAEDLIGGGYDISTFNPINDYYYYDPETNSWTPAPACPASGGGSVAFKLGNSYYVCANKEADRNLYKLNGSWALDAILLFAEGVDTYYPYPAKGDYLYLVALELHRFLP